MMTDDPSNFLNDLPIWKLKLVAAEYRIDVSACRYKRDYVERIRSKRLTQAQASGAIAKAKKGMAEKRDDSGESAVEKDIERIADAPVEIMELPADEEKTIERNIDEALMMKPSFFEIDSTAQSAYNRMIVGDFYQALKTNREARLRSLEMISNFEVYAAAVSIRAADELLTRLHEKTRLDPTLRTALAAAKKAFVAGSPRLREEALESLETLACKTYEAAMSESDQDSEELRGLLADYESFGTRTEEPRRYLEIAAQARQAFDPNEYRKLVKSARKSAEVAREFRKKEIENAFGLVRASTAEAKDIGVPVDKAEASMAEARSAFDGGQFKRAVELLAAVENSMDSAHLDVMRQRKDLEASQAKKVSMTILKYEPMISESGSYGIEVQEASAHLASSKAALSRRDIVAAAKFARRVDEVMPPIEKELDHMRIEKGVLTKVADRKCDKCDSDSIYAFSDGTKKCVDCREVYRVPRAQAPPVASETSSPSARPASRPTMPPIKPPEEPKKKRGLFRW
jgi:hypothetical protein